MTREKQIALIRALFQLHNKPETDWATRFSLRCALYDAGVTMDGDLEVGEICRFTLNGEHHWV